MPAIPILFFGVMALSSTVPAHAQATKGAIAGRVTDSSGAVLQGAQIQLQSRDEKFASDDQGEFLIAGIAPGDYRVKVSYVGFSDLETPVTVAAGETAHVDARMTVSSANQQVIVTSERPHGEDEAINRTRAADNLLQVLPAEVITSLPNANVADALGRLPSITLEPGLCTRSALRALIPLQ